MLPKETATPGLFPHKASLPLNYNAHRPKTEGILFPIGTEDYSWETVLKG